MKVLFLTQYFPPEVGAPQNRLLSTARSLMEHGADVTVLTAMPNYPEMRIHHGYEKAWSREERIEGMRVLRSWIFVSDRRGIAWRLCNYFSFVLSSLWVGLWKLRRSDVLIVESPPLFLGITAMLLARAKRARLVFNVSDLWPESAVQLGLVTNRTMIRLSTWLELLCYRQASLITGQTQGIVDNIKARCPNKKVIWLPNGVDFGTMDALREMAPVQLCDAVPSLPANAKAFAYAGIIGHAQGLDVVLDAAVQLRERRDIHFLLIGDGPERERLVERSASLALANVHFVDRMPRADLIRNLCGVTGVVVPLRRNELFKGAIPSKIFEALALERPILLGVEGEAKLHFIERAEAGLAFAPEDATELARAAVRYADDPTLAAAHGRNGRRYAAVHFDRAGISRRLWEELQHLVTPNEPRG